MATGSAIEITKLATPQNFAEALKKHQISNDDLEHFAAAVSSLGIVTTISEKAHQQKLAQALPGTTSLRQKIGTFKTLRWSGWRPHLVTKTVYLVVDEIVSSEIGKWVAFLACIAGSAALTTLVYLAFVGGPITAAVIIAAIIVGGAFCMQQNMITPEQIKQVKWSLHVE